MPGEEILKELGVAPILLGILIMFWKGDEALAPAFRQDVSNWLLGLSKLKGGNVWPEIVNAQFVKVFGEKHMSWRCFWGSTLASILAYTLISIALIIATGASSKWFVTSFALLIATNTIGDFVSLLETRYILKNIISDRLNIIAGILIDLFVTIILTAFFIVISVIFWTIMNEFFDIKLKNLLELFMTDIKVPQIKIFDNELFDGLFFTFIVPVLTTFVTSIWIWMAALGAAGARLVPGLLYILPMRERPVRSIGITATLLVFIGSVALWLPSFLLS